MQLTDKQQRFCEEYIVDFNGTQAAIRAGYSKKTANEQAARMLANVSIQQKVCELQKALSEKTGITAERILQELAHIGFNNMKDFINGGNSILELKSLDANLTAAVASVKTTTNEVTSKSGNIYSTVNTEIKLHNKISALELMGKHIGLFEKDNSQKKPDPIILNFVKPPDAEGHKDN